MILTVISVREEWMITTVISSEEWNDPYCNLFQQRVDDSL